VGDGGALVGADRGVGECRRDVLLGCLSESVGAGEQAADFTPDAGFEFVGVDLAWVVGAAFGSGFLVVRRGIGKSIRPLKFPRGGSPFPAPDRCII
jgi:hypothetical protein